MELPRLILCPVDLSALSGQALRLAETVTRGTGARITALYAEWMPMPLYFTPSQIEGLQRQLRASLAEAERSVAEFVAQTLGAGAAGVEVKVVEAAPVEGILAAASGLGSDWIVMGTHGRGGINRWMMGSVAERVLRASRIPVVTVRGGTAPPAPVAIHRILCPVNDSAIARLSLELAARLASRLGAELTVMHVKEEEGRKAITDLCAWIPESERSTCEIRELTREGEAAREILTVAGQMGCDLLVMGARHRRFFDSTVIGTTTVRVVRHAPCPVLTAIEPAERGSQEAS